MKYENVEFSDSDVQVDSSIFDKCKFKNCTLIFEGGDPPSFVNCNFDNTNFAFTKAAGNTLQFLANLYKGSFRVIAEDAIDTIRGRNKH
jgi:hypothetical protein